MTIPPIADTVLNTRTGRYLQNMVDVLADQDSLREVASVFETLESYGIDRQRLADAMDSGEPWGKFVHAFEFVTALSVLLTEWPEPTGGPTVIEDDLPDDPLREQYEAVEEYDRVVIQRQSVDDPWELAPGTFAGEDS